MGRKWEENVKTGIKKGDYNAFRLLYDRFYPGLCVIACRYTGKSEIAEEIVQETFMRMWENHKNINIRSNLHSYLCTSVRNSSINYLKHLMVERKFSAEKTRQLQKAVNYMHISQEDGSSILIYKEMHKSLRDALESLPPKCREIFFLHREEGFKHSEIAKKLDISQNTVQRQISIALEKLRDKLSYLYKV